MVKGITPIISIIILLLITVALAGAAWSFLQGFLYPQIQKAFTVSPGAAYCTQQKTIKVFVINTGYQSQILTPNDWVILEVDGNSGPKCVQNATNYNTCGLMNNNLSTGETKLIVNWSCGGSCPSGARSIDLGTTSSVQHFNVYCP